jgi:hypothetical protein
LLVVEVHLVMEVLEVEVVVLGYPIQLVCLLLKLLH